MPTISWLPGASSTARRWANPKHPWRTSPPEGGLSSRYLATIWATLTATAEEAGPIAALQALWRALPPPPVPGDGSSPEDVRAGCERMRDFVVQLRRQLTPKVKNLTAPGLDDGSQSAGALEESPACSQPDALHRRRFADRAGLGKNGLLPGGPAAVRALVFPPEAGGHRGGTRRRSAGSVRPSRTPSSCRSVRART